MRVTGNSAAAIDGIVTRMDQNPSITENEEKEVTDTGEHLAKIAEAADRMHWDLRVARCAASMTAPDEFFSIRKKLAIQSVPR